jgi:hypothetical protein
MASARRGKELDVIVLDVLGIVFAVQLALNIALLWVWLQALGRAEDAEDRLRETEDARRQEAEEGERLRERVRELEVNNHSLFESIQELEAEAENDAWWRGGGETP